MTKFQRLLHNLKQDILKNYPNKKVRIYLMLKLDNSIYKNEKIISLMTFMIKLSINNV